MTIIIVNDYAYVNGGAGQVALMSAVELSRLGRKVILFTAVGPVGRELMHCPNLTVICLNQYDILSNPNRIKAAINGLWNRKAGQQFALLLKQLDPRDSLIHIHSCSKGLSTSIIATALSMNFKIIYHLHDYAVACPNMGFFCYPNMSICYIKPLSLRCCLSNCDRRNYMHKVWRLVRQVMQRSRGRLPAGIHSFAAVSNFSYSILKPYLPENSQVRVIRNPVNIEKNLRVNAENNTYFLFIGRLNQEKNPLLLARAALEMDVPIIFIGEGPCREEIMKTNPDAVITGWLGREEVYQYIKKARVVVMPSSWYETQGMVVSEAAAMGVPVIISDICAAQEFIINGLTGIIFKTGNLNDLKEKMELLQDDEAARAMSIAAYDHFWGNPQDMNTYMRETLSLYSDVLRA